MNFSLHDLGIAYRKSKVDLYYSSQPSLLAIADYERQLSDHLHALKSKLEGKDEAWIKEESFLGGWTLVPKSIDLPENGINNDGLIFSSPVDTWKHACKLTESHGDEKKPKAEFRLMAQASLDFHVLSALWMLKVGHQYDKHLTDSACGNRLRRRQNGNVNPLSLGSFRPYLKPFRDWRDNGIETMRASLAGGKRIVALTADVSSFYHELNPSFMLLNEFNKLFDLLLTEEETKLHRLFINALQAWAKSTPLKKGLPVGLPASAVVANMALIELDRLIEKQIVPLYYGRYVDDVLLVMENSSDFRSTKELWQWVFDRSFNLLCWTDEEQKHIQFQPTYLSDSRIHFANDKNKVFLLVGEQGKRLVESIAHQIHQQASEWRALPNLPRDPARIGVDFVTVAQCDGETADNLRKADVLTMRRAGFAIKLRDFEAYERDLSPDAWQAHRHAFLRAFIQHVLVLPHFFDLALYLPRVIRLATACEDFEYLRQILDELDKVCVRVEEDCTLSIKSCSDQAVPDLMSRWRKNLFQSVRESISAAFPTRLSREAKAAWKAHMEDYLPSDLDAILSWPPSVDLFKTEHQCLFSFDLAHIPFRFISMPKEMVAQRGIITKKNVISSGGSSELLPDSIEGGIKQLAKWTKFRELPNGLLFATRPFNLTELALLVKNPFSESTQAEMHAVVLATRGFSINEGMPHWDKHGTLQIPHEKSKPRYGISVSSWKTEYKSWVASVMRKSDPDLTRYVRLNRLLNGLISQPRGTDYFILPELSLPAQWFMRLAHKLNRRGISLIAGIEYLHVRKKGVRNQVWAALSHDGLGFPSLIVYRQDKQHPALHEELELKRLADLELKPEKRWKVPPVIQHGDFRFSLLVCSELTNIAYRSALRGEVDALFVPEWNRDTNSFNVLVESAALDIHAYIIQCNDRKYGDSRIRAPFQDPWMRDLLRVKGGIYDYFVSGCIDIQALRQFQSSHRSSDRPFKPVPDGFENDMNYWRKVVPVEEPR